MWSRMDRSQVLHRVLPEDLLHSRLPPNIETLIFHDSRKRLGYEPSEVAFEHIFRLLPCRRELLPKLSCLKMVVRHPRVKRRFERILSLDKVSHEMTEEKDALDSQIYLRKSYPIFTTTTFDDIPDLVPLPLKRWTGSAYTDVKNERPWRGQEVIDNIINNDHGDIPENVNMENLRRNLGIATESEDETDYYDSEEYGSDEDVYDSEEDTDGDGEYVTIHLL